jgi:hypothetical protein
MCYNSAAIVNKILGPNGFANYLYWSSTEEGSSNAWFQRFGNGIQGYGSKGFNYYVRAVRIHTL